MYFWKGCVYQYWEILELQQWWSPKFVTTIHICTSTFRIYKNFEVIIMILWKIMPTNAICISLCLALCILKSVDWWANWLMNENWALSPAFHSAEHVFGTHEHFRSGHCTEGNSAQKAKSTVLALFLVPYKQFWNSISLLQHK